MVHASSPYEEMFVRRNAILLFLQRYFSPSTIDFQIIALCSDIPRLSASCLPRLTDMLYMRVSILLVPSCLHLEAFLTPNTVQLTMYTTPNAPVCFVSPSSTPVFYPRLFPGDRVARGPDWQWGNQGNGEEGEVIEEKSWKGVEGCAVRVRWDNDDQNVYRYGAEHCYDVILCLFLSLLRS